MLRETTSPGRGLCGLVCHGLYHILYRCLQYVFTGLFNVPLLFIAAVPNTKLCAWGEEDSGGHVL